MDLCFFFKVNDIHHHHLLEGQYKTGLIVWQMMALKMLKKAQTLLWRAVRWLTVADT